MEDEQIVKLFETHLEAIENTDRIIEVLSRMEASTERLLECLLLDYSNVVAKIEGISSDEVVGRIKSSLDSFDG